MTMTITLEPSYLHIFKLTEKGSMQTVINQMLSWPCIMKNIGKLRGDSKHQLSLGQDLKKCNTLLQSQLIHQLVVELIASHELLLL